MKVSFPLGNCPNHPHIQLLFTGETTSKRSPHLTGIRKDSPPILSSSATYTSSTVSTPSIFLVLQELADATCTSEPCDPPPHCLYASFMAIREKEFNFSAKLNQGSSGGSHRLHIHHTIITCHVRHSRLDILLLA